MTEFQGEDGNHQISMIAVDDLFHSSLLIEECSKWNFAIIGTLRQERFENASISNKAVIMKVTGRQYEISWSGDNIYLITSGDNSVMIMASNSCVLHRVQQAPRWD